MIVLMILGLGVAVVVIVAAKMSGAGGAVSVPAAVLLFSGDGEYSFKIVGESYRQDDLAQLAGGRTEDGVHLETLAELAPEASNPHDANAVAVTIGGRQVGYLSRSDAVQYRTRFGSQRAMCNAMIAGGWDRGPDDVGLFGVRLDIDEDWSTIGP